MKDLRVILLACMASVNIRLKAPKSRLTVPGAAPRASRFRAYSRIRCVVISTARKPPKKLLRLATRLLQSPPPHVRAQQREISILQGAGEAYHLWEQGVGGSNPLTPTTYFYDPGTSSPLDPMDRDSPLGQPAADLPPGLGLAPLPGVHALLGHHDLRELIARNRLDQTREIGARSSQLEQQGFRGDADRGRCGRRQRTIVRDTTA